MRASVNDPWIEIQDACPYALDVRKGAGYAMHCLPIECLFRNSVFENDDMSNDKVRVTKEELKRFGLKVEDDTQTLEDMRFYIVANDSFTSLDMQFYVVDGNANVVEADTKAFRHLASFVPEVHLAVALDKINTTNFFIYEYVVEMESIN